jgi:hypothetical protein
MESDQHRFVPGALAVFLLATFWFSATPQDPAAALPTASAQSKKNLANVRVESITGDSHLECVGGFEEGVDGMVGRYTFFRGASKVWERDLPIVLYRFILKDDGSFEGVGLRTGPDKKALLVLAAVDPSGIVTERLAEDRRLLGPHSGSTPSWNDVAYCSSKDLVIHGVSYRVDDRSEDRLLTYRWGHPELESQATIQTCIPSDDSEPKPRGRIVSLRCTEDGRSIFALWEVRPSGTVASKYGKLTEGMGNVVSVFDGSGRTLACFAMGDAIQRMDDAGCRLDARWPDCRCASWEASSEPSGTLRALIEKSEVEKRRRILVEHQENGEARVRVED